MSFVVKKRDLTDPAQLQALIVEHADDLERGLTILDSRLLLGQASIDIVGLDADGALVLIAVGLVADEEMFLKALDAYSWCLEYPEAIHRLYPTVQFSAAQPPRVMFVVERMPDAFHRKIKQLGFAEVDCVEFRHLDVDGTAAVYFDSLARLRRAVAPPAPEQNGAPTAPVANGRPTSLKLQKLLGADRPVTGREPAPVVRMVHRATPRPEPKPAACVPRSERVVASRPVDEPVTASSRSTVEMPAAPGIRAAVPKPSRTASPSPDLALRASVTEAIAGVPELLAQNVETVEAMVEPFVVAERPTQNGRVDSVPMTIHDPEPENAPAASVRELVVAEPFRPIAEPVAPAPLLPDDAATLVASASAPEMIAAAISAPEPQLVVPDVLRLESRPVAEATPDSNPLAAALAETIVTEPKPAIAQPTAESLELIVSDPVPAVAELSVETLQLIVTDPEPMVAQLSVQPLPPIGTEPEPVIAEPNVPSLEAIAPVAPTAAPSVFSRRLPEPVPLTRAELRVSFAGMANELLSQPNPTPAMEPPVSIQRPSVEEITRAALEELVGATEKRATEDRSTAFARPAGAFSKSPTPKRPRTITPPPAEGQPVAGGLKLGSASRRIGPPVTGTDSAPRGTETEAAQTVPEGFEGLQFPNDGVLTRQWMEFLNQMAAGK